MAVEKQTVTAQDVDDAFLRLNQTVKETHLKKIIIFLKNMNVMFI